MIHGSTVVVRTGKRGKKGKTEKDVCRYVASAWESAVRTMTITANFGWGPA